MSTVLQRVKNSWRWWGTAVCLALFLLMHPGSHPILAQEEPPNDSLAAAQAILNNMSVAERVGQLFMVTFEGDQASFDSDIADLITNYHVGGVVLSADNNNITGYGNLDNIPNQTSELIDNLQSLALFGQPIVIPDGPEIEEDAVPPNPPPPPPPPPPSSPF